MSELLCRLIRLALLLNVRFMCSDLSHWNICLSFHVYFLFSSPVLCCCVNVCVLKGFEVAGRKQGIHKRRIWLKISSSGLKILDERTGVSQARDFPTCVVLSSNCSAPFRLIVSLKMTDSSVDSSCLDCIIKVFYYTAVYFPKLENLKRWRWYLHKCWGSVS